MATQIVTIWELLNYNSCKMHITSHMQSCSIPHNQELAETNWKDGQYLKFPPNQLDDVKTITTGNAVGSQIILHE